MTYWLLKLVLMQHVTLSLLILVFATLKRVQRKEDRSMSEHLKARER